MASETFEERQTKRFVVTDQSSVIDEDFGTPEQSNIDNVEFVTERKNIDSYIVLEKLGEGGMGVVYKVSEVHSGRLFALKVLKAEFAEDPTALRRFQLEAESLNALDHENIVSVYEHGITASGEPYLVMQYLEGETLDDLIKREGKLTAERAITIAIGICRGLIYAHEKNTIHRDIKPSNIMILAAHHDEPGGIRVKLVDFGIAKILDGTVSGATELTRTGHIFGTTAYMSPEQCQGEEVDWRSDIYSFGCVLYEMITGRPPFHGLNPVQIAVKHVSQMPPRFAAGSDYALCELEYLIFACLNKQRSMRLQSFSSVNLELQRLNRLCGESDDFSFASNRPGILNLFSARNSTKLTHGAAWFLLITIELFWFYTLIAILLTPDRRWMSGLSGLSIFCMMPICAYAIACFLDALTTRQRIQEEHVEDGKTMPIRVVSYTTMICAYLFSLLVGFGGLTNPPWLQNIYFTIIALSITIGLLLIPYCRIGQHLPNKGIFKAVRKLSVVLTPILILIFIFGSPAKPSRVVSGYAATMHYFGSDLGVQVLKLALQLDGSNEKAYMGLAVASPTVEEAIKVISSGIEKCKNKADLYSYRSFYFERLKKLEPAMADINRALFYQPDNVVFLETQTSLYRKQGDFKRALQSANRSAALLEREKLSIRWIQHERLLIYLATSRNQEAVLEASNLIESSVSDEQAVYILLRAIAYKQMNEARLYHQQLKNILARNYWKSTSSHLVKAYAAKILGMNDESSRYQAQAFKKGGTKFDLEGEVFRQTPGLSLEW